MPTREEHATSLRDSVTQGLRARIVSGELPPGSRLVERQLADLLGVSRVPVREALRVLEREGFAEERATRGMVVRRLSDDDVTMLFAVRESLEELLCQRLVDVLDEVGVATLQEVVDRAAAHTAAGRVTEAVSANAEFHALLVELADSRVLSSIIEPVAGRMAWLLNQHTDPGAMNAEHQLIVDALREGDGPRATELFRRHLDHSRSAVQQHESAQSPRR
jgi:DNA-binding GntR family transcriptional regulator